jgi:Cof subfamily protein (haloacid dehalogenase superfamily)
MMKRKIKMIVTDLDDTLFHNDKTVSERSREVLQRLREQGIKTAFATGRSINVKRLVPLELFDGYVVNNGAVGYVVLHPDNSDAEKHDIIYSSLMPYEIIRPLLTACDKRGLQVVLQTGDADYANFDISKVWSSIKRFEIVDFSQIDSNGEKIYIVNCTPEDAEFIKQKLHEDLYLTVSRDLLWQVMHKNATKSKAVAKLAELWGIEPEAIVAFGDDLNDLDMLAYAGIGVAMSNALPEVKAVADAICLSNEEDGVARWLIENITE